jgi:hypothetical protein
MPGSALAALSLFCRAEPFLSPAAACVATQLTARIVMARGQKQRWIAGKLQQFNNSGKAFPVMEVWEGVEIQ